MKNKTTQNLIRKEATLEKYFRGILDTGDFTLLSDLLEVERELTLRDNQ